MLEQLEFLAKPEERAFKKIKFKGKLAGKSWKYAQNLDGLIRTRLVISIMSILVLNPVIINYLLNGVFLKELFIERMILSALLFAFALLYNKFRIISIIGSALVVAITLYPYLTVPGYFDNRIIGFLLAIIALILSGIYHHLKLQKIEKELRLHLNIDQLAKVKFLDSNKLSGCCLLRIKFSSFLFVLKQKRNQKIQDCINFLTHFHN